MLLKKHYNALVFEDLKEVQTANGWTLQRIIQSGLDNSDSTIGVYAGDSESYTKFASIFDPIISDYHDYSMNGHYGNLNIDDLPTEDVDPENNFILSTRIRVARNLRRFALPAAISYTDRKLVEAEIVDVLRNLPGDLGGVYYQLENLTLKQQQELIMNHFLFKPGN